MSQAIRRTAATEPPPMHSIQTAPESPAPLVEEILLTQIVASPTNPRKTFNEEALAELAESIKAKGVLQPILVRRMPQWEPKQCSHRVNPSDPSGGMKQVWDLWCEETQTHSHTGCATKADALKRCEEEGRYQLVAGERRFRASKMAGLKTIPCIVRTLTDKEALEIQVIENLQRADLAPLEEAEGYKRLIDSHGYTADTLAQRLHKSKSYVYGSLKLCGLPEVARAAVTDGRIPLSTAQLIARIPNEKLRERAAKDIVTPQYATEPMSFRGAKQCIERSYMTELKGAPFSREDATLVVEAGACVTCPKMTGNNRVEFPDGRADICTDPACFQSKVTAHQTRLLTRAGEKGHDTLTKTESRKLFSYGYLRQDTDWLDTEERCLRDDKQRTYKQLLGKAVKPTAALDDRGKLRYLVKKETAKTLLEVNYGIKLDVVQPSRSTSSSSRGESAAEAERREREAAVYNRALGLVGARVAERVATDGLAAELLRLLIKERLDVLDDEAEIVARRRGLEFEEYQEIEALEKLLPSLDEHQLAGLLAELFLMSEWRFHSKVFGDTGKAVLQLYGIDFNALVSQAKAQDKAEQKAAKPAGKKAAAAKN